MDPPSWDQQKTHSSANFYPTYRCTINVSSWMSLPLVKASTNHPGTWMWDLWIAFPGSSCYSPHLQEVLRSCQLFPQLVSRVCLPTYPTAATPGQAPWAHTCYHTVYAQHLWLSAFPLANNWAVYSLNTTFIMPLPAFKTSKLSCSVLALG